MTRLLSRFFLQHNGSTAILVGGTNEVATMLYNRDSLCRSKVLVFFDDVTVWPWVQEYIRKKTRK
jgi:hypothetical protein